MSQAPNSDICGSPVYVLRSEYQLGGRLCCLEENVPFSDMFPPKHMHVFLCFVMRIATNICRCRNLGRKLRRQRVGQDIKGEKWHRGTKKLFWFILPEDLALFGDEQYF